MKLTDGEKLIAVMLADIMSHLGVQGELNPELVKTALFGDDAWALKWKYHGLFHDEGPSDAIVAETAAIMSMCRVLEASIAALNQEDRDAIPLHRQKVFVGFDGNAEPHYGVAVMLINNLDWFDEWADRDLNSHHTTLNRYRSMKAVYDEIEIPISGEFPLEAIKLILGI